MTLTTTNIQGRKPRKSYKSNFLKSNSNSSNKKPNSYLRFPRRCELPASCDRKGKSCLKTQNRLETQKTNSIQTNMYWAASATAAAVATPPSRRSTAQFIPGRSIQVALRIMLLSYCYCCCCCCCCRRAGWLFGWCFCCSCFASLFINFILMLFILIMYVA